MLQTDNLFQSVVSQKKQKTRQSLSAVVMTKNVEAVIEKCLKSITWADEIVVIDGFSTDRTMEICKKYTDKIIQNRWDGFRFCTERNLGTEHATGDWVLQIDPDECMTEDLKTKILEVLVNVSLPYVAYEYRKKNYFLGHWMQYGGWYHYTLHFFKKGYAEYEGIIHESLKVYGPVGKIEAAVEHYPFQNIAQFIDRHNGYSDREALQILEKKEILPNSTIWYHLTLRPVKLFIKFYIKKKGYRDGIYGFIFSILFSWVHFLNWLKYWELVKNHARHTHH